MTLLEGCAGHSQGASPLCRERGLRPLYAQAPVDSLRLLPRSASPWRSRQVPSKLQELQRAGKLESAPQVNWATSTGTWSTWRALPTIVQNELRRRACMEREYSDCWRPCPEHARGRGLPRGRRSTECPWSTASCLRLQRREIEGEKPALRWPAFFDSTGDSRGRRCPLLPLPLGEAWQFALENADGVPLERGPTRNLTRRRAQPRLARLEFHQGAASFWGRGQGLQPCRLPVPMDELAR